MIAAPAAHGLGHVARSPRAVRVESHRDRLLAVKRGEMPWPKWTPGARNCTGLRRALPNKLPERPDYEKANRFLSKRGRFQVN